MNVRSLVLLNVLAFVGLMSIIWHQLTGEPVAELSPETLDLLTVTAESAYWMMERPLLIAFGLFFGVHCLIMLCRLSSIDERYEITYIRICPHCGVDQPTGDRCQGCGKHRTVPISYYQELESRYQERNRQQFCFSCGADYPPDAAFCIGCGKPTPNTGKTRAL